MLQHYYFLLRKDIQLFCFLLLFGVCAHAQSTISGKVTSAKDQSPLPGVTVTVKGSSNAVVSNSNGIYLINASGNAVLIFTSINYEKQEFSVNNQTEINVSLQENTTGLNEVVVIGYGTKKKIHLTGSVANISGSELKQAASSNLTNLIAGRLPGVIAENGNGRPGSGSSLSIRGASTLGDNSPLIIVDGVQRADFSSFDPNEIENMTVLKDAAASAVYGARANNGVFLITTKRGQIGKPSVTYTGSVGIQQPTQYPELMSAYEYATTRNQGLLNRGYDPKNPAQTSLFIPDSLINRYKAGAGTDWYKLTFKNNPILENHNVSVNGGTDALKYFVSLGSVNQDGMYDNINYKAYKFRSNVDAKITNSLKLGIDLEGRQENYTAPGYDANSIFSLVIRQDPSYLFAYFPDGKANNLGGEHPIEMVRNSGYNRSLYNTFQGTLSLTQDLAVITKGLSTSARASYGKQYNFNKYFFLPYTMYNQDGKGNVTGTKVVGGQTSLSESFNHYYSSFYNVALNYQRTFGKHDLSGLVLYEQNENLGDQFGGSKKDFPISTKDEFFVSGPTNQTLNGYSFINDARKAVVGRLSYVFNNKYIVEGSFRYDGSYIFPEGKRFGFFPAVSAGWRISEESFIKNNPSLSFIDNLKLRASKGLIGNDKVSAFQYEDSYTILSNSGPFFNNTPVPLIYYGVYPNPNITWEKSDNTNIGLEASLWKGLFGFEFDYFMKDTRDILWSRVRSVPGTFGRSLPNENYAKVKNKGFEIVLTHQNQINQFSYNIRAISSYASNKVTQIDDPAGALDYEKQLGKPIGYRVGYQAVGLFQSKGEADGWMGGKQFGTASLPGDIKYADIDGNGVIDSKDQFVLSDKTGTPGIMFGLSGGLKWKGFNANFLLQGAAATNFLISSTGRNLFQNGGSSNNFKYLSDSWSPTNTDAKYPLAWVDSRAVNDRTSSVWLKDAAYIRLKSADIGYSFSNLSLKSLKISNLRIFVSGTNLATWSKLKEFDPEAETGSGAYYPQQRVLSTGVSVTF